MERKNSRPPCYVRSLRRTAYLCKQNQQCLFAWTSILSLPLQRVCKGLIDWLLQIMQNGRTLFLRSPRQKKICYPPAQPRNGFAWWPQHLHSWEVLHRVGSSWEEKESRLLFFVYTKSDLFKAKRCEGLSFEPAKLAAVTLKSRFYYYYFAWYYFLKKWKKLWKQRDENCLSLDIFIPQIKCV